MTSGVFDQLLGQPEAIEQLQRTVAGKLEGRSPRVAIYRPSRFWPVFISQGLSLLRFSVKMMAVGAASNVL